MNQPRRCGNHHQAVIWLSFLLWTGFGTGQSLKPRGTLQLVQVIHRHGARNPLKFEPGHDLYRNETDWPGGWGQLTPEGVMQGYELGLFLRDRYQGFLDSMYHQDEASVLSSETERTIRTVLSLLRGLYPALPKLAQSAKEREVRETYPNLAEILDEAQIIPVKTISATDDDMLHVSKSCPKSEEEFQQFTEKDPAFLVYRQDLNEQFHDFFENSNGQSIQTYSPDRVFTFLDIFEIMNDQNRTLPDWVRPEALKLLPLYVSRYYKIGFSKFKRSSSRLVKEMLTNMDSKKRALEEKSFPSKPQVDRQKLYIYSGHDITIATVLSVLGMQDDLLQPPFASALIIELHRDELKKDPFTIQLFMRNETRGILHHLQVPDCPAPCSLIKLNDILTPVIPDNNDLECAKGFGVGP